MLLLLVVCSGTPKLFSNLPSCVNLRTWESMEPALQPVAVASESEQLPFPPIQTLSLWSIEIPWLDVGHTRPAAGPPQEFTRLPSGSNSRTGGAAAQHSPIGGVRVAPASVRWLRLASPR